MAKKNEQGYVYVLSNPCFSYLKIGHTIQDPVERAIKLSSAQGVPKSFKVEYAARVNNCVYVEDSLHELFIDCHIAKEFYDIKVDEARLLLETKFGGIDSESYIRERIDPMYDRRTRAGTK